MPVSLYHREYGTDGPAIVLLHGLFGSSANWGSIARELSGRYRVIVPDLRNHGQSPHVEDMGYPAMAGDVVALCERLALDRPVIVGHSMGGKVAMCLALAQADGVRGLGVVDIAPVAYEHDFSIVLDAFEAVDLQTLQRREQADQQMAAHLPDPRVRAFLLQNLVRDADGWHWRLNLAALRANMSQITGFDCSGTGPYNGPTRFIHGNDSDYLLPDHHPRIRRLFPAAGFCPVADAGHWVYAEQRAGFMHCLEGLLEAI
ncbi:MAG: alpha/beta fold hydrolase [Gammaproteobacteria bacterium]|nr:MAG: alpha/beta fold hydrolase [Gammaproteobacteria bacterium]